MSRSAAALPELVPILSRGKHRHARKGACFMEMAAYLAGERWSDHPRCTHPLLGELARLVNDFTSDDNRSQLVDFIPSVIGLTSDDVRVDARIALRCARVALPIVSAERQNVMAVSILAADRLLAELDGRPPQSLEEPSRGALEQAPHAAEWGLRMTRRVGISTQGFRRHSAPNTVRYAVQGIAEACIPNADQVLRELLSDAIGDCAATCRREGGRPPSRIGAPVDDVPVALPGIG